MEEIKKNQVAEVAAELKNAGETKPKRRWKYVGPPFKTGIYLPDLTTKINPDTASDVDIDAYVKRFPKLRGGTFQEV